MVGQTQILSNVLHTGKIDIILENNLDESYFPDYVKEYRWILDFEQKNGSVPSETSFIDEFPDFALTPDTELSDSFLIKKIQEEKKLRICVNSFNDFRDAAIAGDVEKAVAILSDSYERLTSTSTLEPIDIFADDSRLQEYYKRRDDLDAYYVTTGLPELDAIIGGWDRREELATIVARTNQGKSWILLKSALAAAEKGLRVGLYSGEMSAMKVGYRLDTLREHISNKGIIRGDVNVCYNYEDYINNKMRNFPGKILVITPLECGGEATVDTLRAFIKKEKLDMLCIDQHSLMEDKRKGHSPIEKAANISRDLKILQVTSQIPIISVCQQNRNSTENGVDSTHIAQSDRIGQDSTIIIAFEQKDGVLKLKLIKARDASVGEELQYCIDFDKGVFNYVAPDDSQEDELADEFGGGSVF